jgi:outer membrane protein OmpA-like peptidoglycan-associated protein
MKKILPWLLLLLLLIIIIFCVWTKKDSIHVNSNSHTETALSPVMLEEVRYIDYKITQQNDKSYTLNGNFRDTQQQVLLSDTMNKMDKKLLIKNTATNSMLLGEPALELTNKILPHFMSQYVNGKISYSNQKLKISGTAKSYEAQHEMQRLLNTSILASQDNSSVSAAKPIIYTINKNGDKLHLTGTFNDQGQINRIKEKLPAHTTTDFQLASYHTDKGSLPIVEKILPTFVAKYTNGKIEYSNEKLTISGIVQSGDDLREVASLLHNPPIVVHNHTIIDPAIKKAADLAKQKAQEAERKTQELAEAERKAQELAEAEVASQEAKRKADADAKAKLDLAKAKAKLAKAAELKAKLTSLLQLNNIEFNVNKSTLTDKGQNTVNTLATILKEYTAVHIEIAGHTDSDGSAEYNQKLSQSRVDMVKSKLVAQQIDASRLTAKGYGETKPLVKNTTRENKAKNRRVEINIQGE